jgi:hypothetical protein
MSPDPSAPSNLFKLSNFGKQVSGVPDAVPMARGFWPEGWRLALRAHQVRALVA